MRLLLLGPGGPWADDDRFIVILPGGRERLVPADDLGLDPVRERYAGEDQRALDRWAQEYEGEFYGRE